VSDDDGKRREDMAELAEAGGTFGDDEWSLVREAQKGDRASFERLYRLHSGRVHALCLRLSGRAEEAEDLTQEVFVRAWKNMGTFREPGHFRAWLSRVAVNLVMTARRTLARRGSPLPLDETLRPRSAPEPASPGVSVDLDRAISTLPDRSRAVLVLHDIYGFRHEEIAAMTGSAVGTSKAQLHRARRRLREVLGR